MNYSKISVVIPAKDEVANVSDTCARIKKSLDADWPNFEIIYVADGCSDGTEKVVLAERARDLRIKLVVLSRNFGQQEALSAGLDIADGDAVITMDGDLQHPPEILPALLDKWVQGHEVVNTIRLGTDKENWARRHLSRLFYRLFGRLSGLSLAEGAADFRLLDKEVVLALRGLREKSRFVRGMVEWIGFRQTSVPYQAAARAKGVSQYRVGTHFRRAARAILSFSSKPLYIVALVGFCLALLSFAYGAYALAMKVFVGVTVTGWASIVAALTFLSGIQLISLGVVGAYVGQVYEEVKGRPLYVIKESHGIGSETDATQGSSSEKPSRSPVQQGSVPPEASVKSAQVGDSS